MSQISSYPTSTQLQLPFLELMEKGLNNVTAIYDKLANQFNLSPLLRGKKVLDNVSYWKRKVRWVMQDLKQKGFILKEERNFWILTEEGKAFLKNAKPGVIVTVFTTPNGESIWAECQSVLSRIEDNSVQLLLTSPPFPLTTPKEYGNLPEAEYISWLTDICRQGHRILKEDGSFVLNLGNTYLNGIPEQSLYQERLLLKLIDEVGFHLAQRGYYYNTTKLPGPTQYVSKDRVRTKDSVEPVFWLGKQPHVFADNRAILNEYADSQKSLMNKYKNSDVNVRNKKPGGLTVSQGIYRDNGGSIPDNLIACANNAVWDAEYLQKCKEFNLTPHPARFHRRFAEYYIKLTTRPGDLVVDLFSGSNVTGQVAESLKRRWIAVEKSFHYIKTSLFRFDTVSVNPMFLRTINSQD